MKSSVVTSVAITLRDLGAAFDRRLDVVGVILVRGDDEAEIDERQAAREHFAGDDVVEHREPGRRDPVRVGIAVARLVDGAERGRQLHREQTVEHGPVVRLELGLDLAELVEHLGDRARFLIEQVLVLERVVAADAHHEVGRVGGQALELAGDVESGRAVDRVERCRPARGEIGLELIDDVGAVPDIALVVEDRIAEQHHMLHRRVAFGLGARGQRARRRHEGHAGKKRAAGWCMRRLIFHVDPLRDGLTGTPLAQDDGNVP